MALLTLTPFASASVTIHGGWDLLTTAAPTSIAGQPFVGIPIVNYNFGGTVGDQATGNADTIVRRLADANGPVDSIPIELVAMQLVSSSPVDFGAGLGDYYFTLQSLRGGPASTGQMTINFGPEGNPHGRFDSFFDVFFDIRFGDPVGPIIFSDSVAFSQQGGLWGHEPPADALMITDVNRFLNGPGDASQDFWPGPVTFNSPAGAQHSVNATTRPSNVPESASTLFLLLIPSLALLWAKRHRVRRRS